jgi:hypothetical protein
MISILAFIGIIIICIYTILFSITELKNKNYPGFIGIILLVIAILGLPFYLMFLKG